MLFQKVTDLSSDQHVWQMRMNRKTVFRPMQRVLLQVMTIPTAEGIGTFGGMADVLNDTTPSDGANFSGSTVRATGQVLRVIAKMYVA